jgi:hypothetical protein
MRLARLVGSLVLSGCATAPAAFHAYSGTRRAPAETARITTDSQREHEVLIGLDDRIYITAVNGRNTEGNVWEKHPRTVYVLPGTHTLDLVWGNGFVIGHGCLEIPTEAGRSYIVRQYYPDKQAVRDRKVYLWAEDQESKQSVTGTAKDASRCSGDD